MLKSGADKFKAALDEVNKVLEIGFRTYI